MKKTIRLCLVSLIALPFYSVAQTDSTAKQKPKNEIGVNLIPAIVALSTFGNTSYDPKFGITYKRQLCNRGMWRVSAHYTPLRSLYLEGSRSSTIWENDTIRTDYFTYYKTNPYSAEIRTGYEFAQVHPKFSFFYGADFFFSHSRTQTYSYHQRALIQTIFPPNPNAGSYYTLLESESDGGLENKSDLFGTNLFFGIKYPFAKHWMVSAQLGLDMNIYGSYGWERTDSKGVVTSSYTWDYNFLRLRNIDVLGKAAGLLNDISLVYRF